MAIERYVIISTFQIKEHWYFLCVDRSFLKKGDDRELCLYNYVFVQDDTSKFKMLKIFENLSWTYYKVKTE